MLICSRDIRDQSRKLSKIAKNFGRLFGRHKFLGAGIVKIVTNLSPLPLRASTEKKFHEDTPTSPEVIESNTVNFRPHFYFSRLKFFGGPPPQLGCALGNLGQCLERVKLQGAAPLNGRDILCPKSAF